MNFKTAFQDSDRAVSPVIGVILMVAITVILAAVIGTFVLGLGDQLGDSTPQASFDIDGVDTAGNGTIDVSKTGGQDLAFSDLRVVVETNGSSTEYDLAEISAEDNWRTADTAVVNANDTELTVRGGTATGTGYVNIGPGDDITVTIVHKPSGGTVARPTATA
ncbi:flagellin domain-containing protein [Halorubrum saccharovorum DSM 1137]|uniref:Flagellin domain-containing protein n=1 Tax=Halorubrum saccharovorum DSM 1137 TaxID=1227484 RepID=M0DX70_9EURY|nr:type IV pilin N-terminal domain-containing protein [Halorubrum saccharovorum]ELZ39322.1 flagellin domain-containing protein [Halorubrum saccharovorum DSM 1137]